MDKHIVGFCLFVEFVNSKINVDQCQSYNYILARVEQLLKQHSVQIIICIMFNILHISVVSQYFKKYSPLLWGFNFQGLGLASSLLTDTEVWWETQTLQEKPVWGLLYIIIRTGQYAKTDGFLTLVSTAYTLGYTQFPNVFTLSQLTSKSTNVLILKLGNYSIHISSTQGDQCPLCGITETEAIHCTVCRLHVSDKVLIYYRRWEMKGKADIKCVIKSSTGGVDTQSVTVACFMILFAFHLSPTFMCSIYQQWTCRGQSSGSLVLASTLSDSVSMWNIKQMISSGNTDDKHFIKRDSSLY